ncbi:MAG: hypothetical protein HQM14_03105 [SAR324 cluster bacterium]|nr:hypothetical protein [SAR324 cluster bacterium]
MKYKHFWKIGWIGLIGSLILIIWGCGDIVPEDEATSGCSSALNDRDYDTAISKCSGRADLAAAYMGKAGYDIINLLDASGKSVKAITDTSATNVLGSENVGFAFSINALKLSESDIPDETQRQTAMEDSKEALEEVIDLFDGATDQSGSELVLETFATMFAVSLEMVLLLDIGIATTLSISDGSLATTFIANTGNHLITDDSSITSYVDTTSLADSSNTVGVVMKKLDGRIWEKEQNLALFYDSFNLSATTKAALGTSDDTLDMHGNLSAVCRSFSDTKNSTDPPGRGVLTLIGKLSSVATKFAAAFSDAESDAAGEVDDLTTTVDALEDTINTACTLKDSITEI